MRTVTQHDLTERSRCRSSVDFPGKAACIEQRQQAGVVNVCVCQKNIVNFSRRTGNLHIFIRISPLLHSKVHQNAFPADFQIGTATSYFVCCTNKYHFHNGSLLSIVKATILPVKNAAQHPEIICRLCRRFFVKAAFAASYDSFLLNNRYFRAKKFQRNAIIVETIFPII